MNPFSQHRRRRFRPAPGIRRALRVCLVAASAFGAAFGLSAVLPGAGAQDGSAEQAVTAATTDAGAYELVVDALLAPAFDTQSSALRWTDPRTIAHCGRHTSVRVNQKVLREGELLPAGPFELEWHADGCGPAGAPGVRIDGWVTLTVFREDWGLSAIVEPSGLRLTSGAYEQSLVPRRAASLTRCARPAQHFVQATVDDAQPAAC